MQTVTFKSSPDRPERETQPAYLVGLGFLFFGAGLDLCSAGGDVSMRRSTSSSDGGMGLGIGLLIGQLL